MTGHKHQQLTSSTVSPHHLQPVHSTLWAPQAPGILVCCYPPSRSPLLRKLYTSLSLQGLLTAYQLSCLRFSGTVPYQKSQAFLHSPFTPSTASSPHIPSSYLALWAFLFYLFVIQFPVTFLHRTVKKHKTLVCSKRLHLPTLSQTFTQNTVISVLCLLCFPKTLFLYNLPLYFSFFFEGGGGAKACPSFS